MLLNKTEILSIIEKSGLEFGSISVADENEGMYEEIIFQDRKPIHSIVKTKPFKIRNYNVVVTKRHKFSG